MKKNGGEFGSIHTGMVLRARYESGNVEENLGVGFAEYMTAADRFDTMLQIKNFGHDPIVTDEQLDALADRFLDLHVRELTRVSFETYLESPECFEMLAEAIESGAALQYDDKHPWPVIVIPPGVASGFYRMKDER